MHMNGQRMPKGEPVKIETGDKLYILNDETDGTKIGFVFVQKYKAKTQSEIGKKRGRSKDYTLFLSRS